MAAAAAVAASSGLTCVSKPERVGNEARRRIAGSHRLMLACQVCCSHILCFCALLTRQLIHHAAHTPTLTHLQPPATIRASTWRCSSTSTNFENKVSRTQRLGTCTCNWNWYWCVWLINAALCLLACRLFGAAFFPVRTPARCSSTRVRSIECTGTQSGGLA